MIMDTVVLASTVEMNDLFFVFTSIEMEDEFFFSKDMIRIEGAAGFLFLWVLAKHQNYYKTQSFRGNIASLYKTKINRKFINYHCNSSSSI